MTAALDSSSGTCSRIALCWTLAWIGSAAMAAAWSAETAAEGSAVDKSEWESAWHVVRPGDTLQGLSERFLGAHDHWRELHLLNPSVKDPDLLFPGQRLRIFVERPTAKLSAQVMAVERDVRELPTPVPWRPASAGDVLLERDALRTAKSASARLRFDDGATVTLSEDSLVFIRRQTAATSPLPRKEIEIQLGQVDVEGASSEAPAADSTDRPSRRTEAIEVVVAGARSLASPEPGQPISTRSRRAPGDLAQFMVFAGKSTVSASGTSIEVPAGSGTSVAAKAAPGPVEALLKAPGGARPAYGEEVEQGAPHFSWDPVPGADHYRVEVCRDPGCGAVVARSAAIAESEIRLDVVGGLPAGELFWRVTAVAPSGLDGFPTPAIRVEAVDAVRPKAPVLALRSREGPVLAPGSCIAALPEPVVVAVDRRGAELPWSLLLDGREIAPEDFRTLSLAGPHQLVARVTDSRGRTADSAVHSFILDGAAPWVDLVSKSARPVQQPAEAADEGRRGRARKRGKSDSSATPRAACDSGLEFLDSSGAWLPIPCAIGAAPESAVVGLDAGRPAVTLRPSGGALALGDRSGLGLGADLVQPGDSLSLASWDVGCGTRQLSLRIVPSPYREGRMLLEVEATDSAGNRRIAGWHVARR